MSQLAEQAARPGLWTRCRMHVGLSLLWLGNAVYRLGLWCLQIEVVPVVYLNTQEYAQPSYVVPAKKESLPS